jgi:hypothetical protein
MLFRKEEMSKPGQRETTYAASRMLCVERYPSVEVVRISWNIVWDNFADGLPGIRTSSSIVVSKKTLIPLKCVKAVDQIQFPL